jgi:hypothetical protein
VAVLPALSMAVAVSVCAPTEALYPLTRQDARPETASAAVQVGAAGTLPK